MRCNADSRSFELSKADLTARTMATMGDGVHLYIWDGARLDPVGLAELTSYLVDGALPSGGAGCACDRGAAS